MVTLPVDEVLADLVQTLATRRALVLTAPPGSGKTSRVPLALDTAPWAEGRTLVLEPRRVAARSAARWMAQQRGEAVGASIGYAVRYDRREGPETRVLVVTEGILLRMLDADPFLDGVTQVVFDEFHERRLDADLALAMVRELQEARDDLRVVVMSATMDPAPVAAFLDAAVMSAEGRVYPVAIAHVPLPVDPLVAVAEATVEAYAATSGHVLAFLPGGREIQRTVEVVSRALPGVPVWPLYGALDGEAQDAAIAPSARRKIVIATNIAETSVTIDGVTAVVDSGLEKAMAYDTGVGLNRLELGPIAQASADQRAGRAGRTQAGTCLRLWPRRDHTRRQAYALPEITRLEVDALVLRLLAWGATDVHAYPFLEPPPTAAIDRALTLLERLGAVEDGRLTAVGRAMHAIPAEPRLARTLVAGAALGCLDEVAWIAVLLSEGDPIGDTLVAARASSGCDAQDRLDRLDARRLPYASRRHHDQLVKAAARAARGLRPPRAARSSPALSRALLAGFPDRVVVRRRPGERDGVMVGGRGVVLAETSGVREAPLFIALRLRPGRRGEANATVMWATPIAEEELLTCEVETTSEGVWDAEAQRVYGLRRVTYMGLTLRQQSAKVPPEVLSAALVAAAREQLDVALALEDPTVAGLRWRLVTLARWRPELGLPTDPDDVIAAALPTLAAGRRSFADLQRADAYGALLGALTWPQREALDRLAPTHVEVPSGSRIALHYGPEGPPVLAARIQELFSWTDTPTVNGGRTRVLLHLLAPNMRPQQVTDDLASFWARGYPEVRKDLRGRYPKHAWPEDPITAAPMRGAKRRR